MYGPGGMEDPYGECFGHCDRLGVDPTASPDPNGGRHDRLPLELFGRCLVLMGPCLG